MGNFQKLKEHVSPAQKFVYDPIVSGKAFLLCVGVITVGLGLHSHFKSFWVQKVQYEELKFKVYEVCKYNREYPGLLFPEKFPCPSIFLERFYLSVACICFILSIASLIVCFVQRLKKHVVKTIDAGYHIISGMLLIVAAAAYLVSAKQIYDLLTSNGVSEKELTESGIYLRTSEKYGAGIFAIILAITYGILGKMLIKN